MVSPWREDCFDPKIRKGAMPEQNLMRNAEVGKESVTPHHRIMQFAEYLPRRVKKRHSTHASDPSKHCSPEAFAQENHFVARGLPFGKIKALRIFVALFGKRVTGIGGKFHA